MRFQAHLPVLGYSAGEHFDADPDDELLAPYLVGGYVTEVVADDGGPLEDVLPDVPSEEEIAKAKADPLRGWLGARELPVSGKVSELRDRVTEALAG